MRASENTNIVDFEEKPLDPTKQPTKTTIKKHTRKNKPVKTNSTKKTAIVSILSTLAVIATIIAIFVGGIKFEQHRQHNIQIQAEALAAKLSKENQ